MKSHATGRILDAIRATPSCTIAVDSPLSKWQHTAIDRCRPVLQLLSLPADGSQSSPVLLMLPAEPPYVFPEWLKPLMHDLVPVTDGVWRFKLLNGQPVICSVTNRIGDAAISWMTSLLIHLPDISAVLTDCQLVKHWDEPEWRDCSCFVEFGLDKVPLAIMHSCRWLEDAVQAREHCSVRQTLRVFTDGDGQPAWQPLLHPWVDWRQLTPEEIQRLGQVCLMINQYERLILEKWALLERQMQTLRAVPGCWFVDYEIECPISFLLRTDEPRWREDDDNILLSWPDASGWSASVEDFLDGTPHDYRDAIPDLPAVLQDRFIGRLFYSVYCHSSLSWRDIAAIGGVWFDLTVQYQHWRTD